MERKPLAGARGYEFGLRPPHTRATARNSPGNSSGEVYVRIVRQTPRLVIEIHGASAGYRFNVGDTRSVRLFYAHSDTTTIETGAVHVGLGIIARATAQS